MAQPLAGTIGTVILSSDIATENPKFVSHKCFQAAVSSARTVLCVAYGRQFQLGDDGFNVLYAMLPKLQASALTFQLQWKFGILIADRLKSC